MWLAREKSAAARLPGRIQLRWIIEQSGGLVGIRWALTVGQTTLCKSRRFSVCRCLKVVWPKCIGGASESLHPMYEQWWSWVQQPGVRCVDETSYRIDGVTYWMWVATSTEGCRVVFGSHARCG